MNTRPLWQRPLFVIVMLVLVVAWAHAMIGLHFWLRVRPWYARLQPAALIFAGMILFTLAVRGRQEGAFRRGLVCLVAGLVLWTDAPNSVDAKQLRELGIAPRRAEDAAKR